MAPPFLDTNILLRHFLQDHPVLLPTATAIIGCIEQGALQARTSDIVIFEPVYTLQRTYKQSRPTIASGLLALLDLPGVLLPGKTRYHQVFSEYCSRSLGFADCFHLVLMRRSSTACPVLPAAMPS